ncbi:MAG: hypothetical protein RXQ62_07125 [Nitrososphaeria archaeon]
MSQNQSKPKLGARIVRAFFVGNLIGILMFVVMFLGGGIITSLAPSGSAIASLPPVDWGTFGWIAGISASIGIELSKDLES